MNLNPMVPSKIKKLFIANRGEIARRIARSARKNGIESIAIAEKSKRVDFLKEFVSEFYFVENENTSLYLNPSEMIRIALETGCDALHPGFGFLSENAQFAETVARNNLCWIGPSPASIDAMASKASAKSLAKSAAVPVIPGMESFYFDPKNPELSSIYQFADQHGYPILFKAAMGGGGKGMRVARNKEEILTAATRAYSEGLNSFGDGSLIVEKYLEFPRHIEIQILGDKHGQVFALSDRECSIQRRHQKIVEEAPAPFLSEITRKKMHDAAINLAKRVNYYSAGTVEMLIDYNPSKIGSEDLDFYFLEMNTRLQVEHPVTEEVLGLDLVDLQFKIAQGEKLEPKLMNREPRGHSIELRIYAEDVKKDFLPSPGVVECFLPHYEQGIRWEIGLNSRDVIDTNFDPMISKLVAWGSDRKECIDRLISTLSRTIFIGPANNISYLEAILSHDDFQEKASTTKYIPIYQKHLLENLKNKEDYLVNILEKFPPNHNESSDASFSNHEFLDINSVTKFIYGFTESKKNPQLEDPQASPILESVNSILFDLPDIKEEETNSSSKRRKKAYVEKFQLTNHSRVYLFKISLIDNGDLVARYFSYRGENLHVRPLGKSQRELSQDSLNTHNRTPLKADLPSKVIKVNVSNAEEVPSGHILMVLESMKMEFEIQSPISGKVEKVFVKEGDLVKAGETLLSWMEEK